MTLDLHHLPILILHMAICPLAASLNIVTIDLSKDLDEKVEFMYRINGKEFKCDEKMKYSNRKLFKSVISCAGVQKPLQLKYVVKPPKHSMYFVLGTHYDKLVEKYKDNAESKLAEMNEDLMSLLTPHLKEFVSKEIGKSIIFPYNTYVLLIIIDSIFKRKLGKIQSQGLTSVVSEESSQVAENYDFEGAEQNDSEDVAQHYESGGILDKIVDLIPKAKAQLSDKWVHIVDSGGQPAYQELLPLFTRAASLNIVTIDLS